MNSAKRPKIKDKKFYARLVNYNFSSILRTHDTPFIAFFKPRIEENGAFVQSIFSAFEKKDYFYAVKANYHPSLLRIIKRMGFGAEVMSEFELRLALKAGFKPARIIFNGVGKTDAALKLAVRKKIKYIIIDSLSEAKKLSKLGKNIPVLIRCHPSLSESDCKDLFVPDNSKLGLSLIGDELIRVLDFVHKKNFRFEGFSFHVAAKQKDLQLHESALISIISFYKSLPALIKNKVKVIDIGGGLDSHLFLDNVIGFNKGIALFFNANNLKLFVEPGRIILNDAGICVSKVITKKNVGSNRYLVVDAATNYLLPLPLAYYPVVSQKKGKKIMQSVVDGICSNAGVINATAKLPPVKEGAVLLVLNCGAYTYNMFEHFYDLRPAVLLIDGKRVTVLNKKEQFNTAFAFLSK